MNETETKQPITWEDVKALIPDKTSLHYVDYRESLDDHTKLIEECIKSGSKDKLYEQTWEWYLDDYYAQDEYEKELKSAIESKFDIDNASDIMEQFNDEIRDTIQERDDSNVLKDLLHNTSKQTMFYDTGYEVESESWSWSEARVRLERILIKKHLGLVSDNTVSNWDESIDMMIRQASYGGQLVIYFYDNVDDFFDTEKIKAIRFKNFSLAIINTGNGSGDNTELWKADIELPFVTENLYLCKNIGYSYTFNVCGMSSDWCSNTDTYLLEEPTKKHEELPESALAETQARDKKLDAIFKAGSCTPGDMNYGRHRRTTYINNYPCGNKCLDCGTFWID